MRVAEDSFESLSQFLMAVPCDREPYAGYWRRYWRSVDGEMMCEAICGASTLGPLVIDCMSKVLP
jgi:hypothetical protein